MSSLKPCITNPSIFTITPLRSNLGYLPFTTTTRKMSSATTFHDFKPLNAMKKPYPLSNLKGKVVLVVNVASNCGFTKQYATLETLYKDMKSSYPNQFEMVGFPCNQFAGQEPGDDDTIQAFCTRDKGVTFPILAKTTVNGNGAEPVWEWMKAEKPGFMGLKMVKWNFEKFLIGRDGKVVERFSSRWDAPDLKPYIVKELEKKA